jgi:splicing factor U2AF subunit
MASAASGNGDAAAGAAESKPAADGVQGAEHEHEHKAVAEGEGERRDKAAPDRQRSKSRSHSPRGGRARKRSRSTSRSRSRRRRRSSRSRSRSRSRDKKHRKRSHSKSPRPPPAPSQIVTPQPLPPVVVAPLTTGVSPLATGIPPPVPMMPMPMHDPRMRVVPDAALAPALAPVLAPQAALVAPPSLMYQDPMSRSRVAQDVQLTRPARRIFCGNLPSLSTLSEPLLHEFFTAITLGIGVTTERPVREVSLKPGSKFCVSVSRARASAPFSCPNSARALTLRPQFIEFRSVPDTTSALNAFQGVKLGDNLLTFARPKDFQPVPFHLAAFVVPIEFCPPPNPNAGPHDNALGISSNATVVRHALASAPRGMAPPPPMPPPPMPPAHMMAYDMGLAAPMAPAALAAPAVAFPPPPPGATVVLRLANLVTSEELSNDSEYVDVLRDVHDECNSMAPVARVVIPRPKEHAAAVAADPSLFGSVFVEFRSAAGAAVARDRLEGRLFSGRKVVATFFAPAEFIRLFPPA